MKSFSSVLLAMLCFDQREGYNSEPKIVKRITRTEIIPVTVASDYGVTPEEVQELFQNHDRLLAVHFE